MQNGLLLDEARALLVLNVLLLLCQLADIRLAFSGRIAELLLSELHQGAGLNMLTSFSLAKSLVACHTLDAVIVIRVVLVILSILEGLLLCVRVALMLFTLALSQQRIAV